MERWRDGEMGGYALKEWLSWHEISVLLDFYTIKAKNFAFFKDYYRLYIQIAIFFSDWLNYLCIYAIMIMGKIFTIIADR
ncbi:MAG: hypothetical protein EA359_13170 [Balneolaceae bacterium]|nr:MAG: hypothetical protein EA359_13170 [Balneolaceae bacterium]